MKEGARYENEGNRTPTAIMDETYNKQADASKGRISRLGKSIIAVTTAAIAAVGSGVGLLLSSGGEKTVHDITYPRTHGYPPLYDYKHPITEPTTHTVPTTNGLEHGLGWGLIGAGALALAGAGILINRYMQKKNSNRN